MYQLTVFVIEVTLHSAACLSGYNLKEEVSL